MNIKDRNKALAADDKRMNLLNRQVEKAALAKQAEDAIKDIITREHIRASKEVIEPGVVQTGSEA